MYCNVNVTISLCLIKYNVMSEVVAHALRPGIFASEKEQSVPTG
jgi:hypothetical protein